MTTTDPNSGTACDWTVSGMDCGSCAAKIKDAVTRLPGVSGVEIGIMSERLRLTLDETQTGRDRVEKVVKSLGYGITPRAAGTKKDFVMPVMSDSSADGHDQNHADHSHDRSGTTAVARDDSGHGSPGHVHDDPADRGKRWYQTSKGKLVIFTAILLGSAWIIELLAPQIGKWAFVAACLIGVAPIAKRAFAALRLGQPFTIESLMTVAAIGALFIDAAEEAALVVFLFAVGEVLEGVAAGKARWHPGTGQSGAQDCASAGEWYSAGSTGIKPCRRADGACPSGRPHPGRWRDRRGHFGRG